MKKIELEEHEQYGHEVKKPLFDLNEDYEVVSPPTRVLRPYSTPETQEMTLIEVESLHEKVCKIFGVERKLSRKCKSKRPSISSKPIPQVQWTNL